MELSTQQTNPTPAARIYIVSGGNGASGEQLVHTVLAQFPDNSLPLITVSQVRRLSQIETVVDQAAATGSLIVHTLVETHLRDGLSRLAQAQGVPTLDMVSGLFAWLTTTLGRSPIEQPGLYHRLNQAYFERIAAIEFAITHDDGKLAQDWPRAEIVLVGVSRVGKTPLSIYLSIQGWKVANVPLVPAFPPPANLFELDPRRVIGLQIQPGQLISHRQKRQRRLHHTSHQSDYTDPTAIYEETKAAHQLFRRAGFAVIDVTDKPIESSANEIAGLMAHHFEIKAAANIRKEIA